MRTVNAKVNKSLENVPDANDMERLPKADHCILGVPVAMASKSLGRKFGKQRGTSSLIVFEKSCVRRIDSF